MELRQDKQIDVEGCEEIPSPHPRDAITGWRWALTLIGLFMGGFLYGLDTTITAFVQGAIYSDLGEIEKLAWVGIGFSMSCVSVALPISRLCNMFDIHWIICISIIIFEVGSAVCASAISMNVLIVGRVIAGAGGAGMYLSALSYVSVFGRGREVALYNALIGISWAVGAVVGPIIGGAFSDSAATWRWAFYINLPAMAIYAPVYIFLYPSHTSMPNVSFFEKFRSLDWVGTILHTGSFVFFLIVVSFSGSLYAWDSTLNIVLWVVWGIFVTLYILQQIFCIFTTTQQRLFPVELLKSKSMVLFYIATSGAGAAFIFTLYYTPLFFQFARGDGTLRAATRMLPFICIYVFASALSGALLPRIRLYAAFYTLSGSLIIIGGALMFGIDISTRNANIYGYEALIATGVGLVWQSCFSIAAAKAEPIDKQRVLGFFMISQFGAISMTLAIAGCLYHNLGLDSMKQSLEVMGIPESTAKLALGGLRSEFLTTLPQEVGVIIVGVVADTIARLSGIVVAGGAVVLICSFAMHWERLEFNLATTK